jgi:lysophospholipase L1-like esterase
VRRGFRRQGTVALAALIAGCGGHEQPRPPRPAATPAATLVVVGDSLAAGRFADTPADAFPQQVAHATRTRPAVLGIPGATTAQLAAQPVPGGGVVAVVEAGTNDFIHQTPRRQFAADYKALLAKVTAASPHAHLVCVTIWMPKEIARQVPATIPPQAYDDAIERACKTGEVADIAGLTDLRGPAGRDTFSGPSDDFHPNSEGHAAIARAIAAQLPASG